MQRMDGEPELPEHTEYPKPGLKQTMFEGALAQHKLVGQYETAAELNFFLTQRGEVCGSYVVVPMFVTQGNFPSGFLLYEGNSANLSTTSASRRSMNLGDAPDLKDKLNLDYKLNLAYTMFGREVAAVPTWDADHSCIKYTIYYADFRAPSEAGEYTLPPAGNQQSTGIEGIAASSGQGLRAAAETQE